VAGFYRTGDIQHQLGVSLSVILTLTFLAIHVRQLLARQELLPMILPELGILEVGRFSAIQQINNMEKMLK
jgi:hypothetical protein